MALRRREIDALLVELAATDPTFESRVIVHVEREPFDGDPEADIVRVLGDCVREVTGRESHIMGANGWMDAALVQAVGIPTVVFGPRGAGFHADVEWVETAHVVEAARVLAETIARFCA